MRIFSEKMINFGNFLEVIRSKKRKNSGSSSDRESIKRRRKLFCLPPGSPDLKPESLPVSRKLDDDQISVVSVVPGNSRETLPDEGKGLRILLFFNYLAKVFV